MRTHSSSPVAQGFNKDLEITCDLTGAKTYDHWFGYSKVNGD